MNRFVIAFALVVVAFVPWASAHEGHDHNVMGTIAVLHQNHLEVTSAKDGKPVTVTLTDKTKILRGKSSAKRDDLHVGDRVVVIYAQEKGPDGKEILAAKEVRLGAPSTPPGK